MKIKVNKEIYEKKPLTIEFDAIMDILNDRKVQLAPKYTNDEELRAKEINSVIEIIKEDIIKYVANKLK